MAFGGKWINEVKAHTCPTPGAFGRPVNRVGLAWQCKCGTRWEIRMMDGVKRWVRTKDVVTRRDVLDELATDLAPHLSGDELSAWRAQTHAVLCELERRGLAGWGAPSKAEKTP